ncbi:hypothetical protein PLEI_4291 [Photobacterium leiognathi lrivu.4.1]|uniref:Uncharacterized protein n=1 Tax=Photobacterium leiognathi lrivu.4.1 TaxID=1248232 RepID=V5H6K2_PHOLE|nr:hypothetical protein PLEI_4291 [Photobacterium leiognathi lrivu.4.1]
MAINIVNIISCDICYSNISIITLGWGIKTVTLCVRANGIDAARQSANIIHLGQ